jgi:hypothetical protein
MPSPDVEDKAADEHPSPENGGPDSDPLADEPSDDKRQKDAGICGEEEEGSTGESAHEGQPSGDRQRSQPSDCPIRVSSQSHRLRNALLTRKSFVLSSRRSPVRIWSGAYHLRAAQIAGAIQVLSTCHHPRHLGFLHECACPAGD